MSIPFHEHVLRAPAVRLLSLLSPDLETPMMVSKKPRSGNSLIHRDDLPFDIMLGDHIPVVVPMNPNTLESARFAKTTIQCLSTIHSDELLRDIGPKIFHGPIHKDSVRKLEKKVERKEDTVVDLRKEAKKKRKSNPEKAKELKKEAHEIKEEVRELKEEINKEKARLYDVEHVDRFTCIER